MWLKDEYLHWGNKSLNVQIYIEPVLRTLLCALIFSKSRAVLKSDNWDCIVNGVRKLLVHHISGRHNPRLDRPTRGQHKRNTALLAAHLDMIAYIRRPQKILGD